MSPVRVNDPAEKQKANQGLQEDTPAHAGHSGEINPCQVF